MKLFFPPKNSHKTISTSPTNQTHLKKLTPTHLNNLLTKTSQTKILKHATQLHAQIITNSFTCHPSLFHNLLNTYSKCNHLTHSLALFSNTHNVPKNIITWTSIITHLAHHNKPFKALNFFSQMRRAGIYPNEYTFSILLPSCAASNNVAHGEQMHCLIWKYGFDGDLFVGCALLDMYAKCGDMAAAKRVFDEMPERNLVCWNAMIVGCLQNLLFVKGIALFKEVVGEEFVCPDQVSFSSVLSACANVGALEFGRQVHGVAIKYGLLSLAYVRNSLMDMYCKCSVFDDASLLFDITGDKDVVAWNVMIMGAINEGKIEDACNGFWEMRREGILPDEATYSSALHASASLATLNQGILIHDLIIKSGFMWNSSVYSSLITMYAKCGSFDDSYQVFEEVDSWNVVCWTAMIAACQQHGHANKVIELYEEMLAKGIKPDCITFVCVISACGHAGRVEEGYAYFNSMTKVHGMNPGHEHYACMVDLLGRAGRLDEAKKFIESMPIKPDSSVWGALLGACTNHGNLEMGREVAKKLFDLEPDNPGNYVLLSNIYVQNGKLKEAEEVRRLMGVKRVRKEPGCSWIDVRDFTFVFKVHDRSHPKTIEIYEMLRKLEDLVKKKGYIAETQYAINSEEGFKEQSLWYHSEKIALAFALLSLPSRAPIRIMKNLRTCGDCHTVMKYASHIFEREIIVRDINRFHRFSNGLCSCGDYW